MPLSYLAVLVHLLFSYYDNTLQRTLYHNKMAVGEEGGAYGVKHLIKTATALGNTIIDLGRKNLTEIPPEILNWPQLEFLYLEGNKITTFPEGFFENLPNLKWLDLRNNYIKELPPSLGSHRCLRNLLLEGNEIKELPLELGFAKCLSGLNLTSNPLQMPPSQILEKGTQEVLKFLREKYAEKMDLTGQEPFLQCSVKTISQSSSEEDFSSGSRDYQGKEHSSWSLPRRIKSTETADPDLRPTHTPVSFHRPPSRPDQIRMQYDRQRAHQNPAERERRHSWSKEGNITKENVTRRLLRPTIQNKQSPVYDRTRYYSSASPRFPDYEAKIAEQQQMAITTLLNEKEDTVLQRLKDKKALNDWRDETRRIRQQKQHLAAFNKPTKVNINVPYGTENNMKEEKPNAKYVAKLQKILSDSDKDSLRKALQDRDLEDRIKVHMEKIQQHRNKSYEDIADELASARRNLELAQNFQKDLDEKRALEYRLRAYTGEEIALAKGKIVKRK